MLKAARDYAGLALEYAAHVVDYEERRDKIFGIGCPKTGTTTLGQCFRILGLRETGWNGVLFRQCLRQNLNSTFKYARRFQGFNDLPWSMIYQDLDRRYPSSKFVLTVRKDSATWLKSFQRHQAHVVGQSVPIGRRAELGARPIWPDGIDGYERHNEEVKSYFAGSAERLLVVCWENGDGWEKLCRFLGKDVPNIPFPHANKAAYGSGET